MRGGGIVKVLTGGGVPSPTCIMGSGKVVLMKRITAPKGTRRKTCCTSRIGEDIFPQFQLLVLLVLVLCKQRTIMAEPENKAAGSKEADIKATLTLKPG